MRLLAQSRSLFSIGGLRKADRPRRAAPATTYIVCTNPRSGSWLLSDGLTSTSVAGHPREWFNPLVEQKRRALWLITHPADLTSAQYLNQVRALGVTANGVCGIKLHYYQLSELLKKLTTDSACDNRQAAKLIARAFPNVKYVWLIRHDKERQAISYQLACSTGNWWLIDGASDRNKVQDREPFFDPHVIARLERTLIENDLKWEAFFRVNGITPLVVSYEDLASDYSGVILRIVDWLGARGADATSIRRSRFTRQSNKRNEEWLDRYRAFKADAGHLAKPSSPIELSSPLDERSTWPLDVIPESWKRWIDHNKRLKTPDSEIVEVLASNGYSRQAAIAEVVAEKPSA